MTTLTLWHGGSLREKPTHYTGIRSKAEYGPGIYVSNQYQLARKYAKGNKTTSQITFDVGTDISEVYIDYTDITQFVNSFVKVKFRKLLISECKCYCNDQGKISALCFLNLITSDIYQFNQTVKTSKALNQFLVQHGVTTAKINNYMFSSGDTTVFVILDVNAIKHVNIRKASTVALEEYFINV